MWNRLQWARATGCDFNNARGSSSQRTGDEHCRKDAHPFLISTQIGDHDQNDTERNVRRPIAPVADIAHKNFGAATLMMRNPVLNLEIEVKSADQSACADYQKQEQADPILFRHSKISRLSFTRRYL